MSTWFTAEGEEALARLLTEWPDAPEERPETLGMILDTARVQVIAYAQGLPDDAILTDYKLVDKAGEEITNIPPRLVWVQLRQSQIIWDSISTPGSDGGDFGPDGFAFSTPPATLGKPLQQMIRPKGVPSVA